VRIVGRTVESVASLSLGDVPSTAALATGAGLNLQISGETCKENCFAYIALASPMNLMVRADHSGTPLDQSADGQPARAKGWPDTEPSFSPDRQPCPHPFCLGCSRYDFAVASAPCPLVIVRPFALAATTEEASRAGSCHIERPHSSHPTSPCGQQQWNGRSPSIGSLPPPRPWGILIAPLLSGARRGNTTIETARFGVAPLGEPTGAPGLWLPCPSDWRQ
jgi:hypothetical protein